MAVNKYFHIGKVNFLNSIAYVGDVIAGSFLVGMIIFIFVYLWSAIFTGGKVIEGFTLGKILWYLVLSESIVTAYSRVIEEIGGEIKSGEIANYLNKPYDYIIYKYAMSIGYATLKFFITFVIGSVIVFLMIGEISFSFKAIPFVLITVILALTLHFTLMALMGVFAFWMEDAKSLHFIYQKLVFTIGGMLIPLSFFPAWLEKISIFLPFSYIAYFPAKLFVMFDFKLFLQTILLQLLWILIFAGITYFLYSKYVKRLSINGG